MLIFTCKSCLSSREHGCLRHMLLSLQFLLSSLSVVRLTLRHIPLEASASHPLSARRSDVEAPNSLSAALVARVSCGVRFHKETQPV